MFDVPWNVPVPVMLKGHVVVALRRRARRRPGDRRVAVRGRHRARQLDPVGAGRREVAARLTARLRRDLPLQAAAALRRRRDRRAGPRAEVRPYLAGCSVGSVGELKMFLNMSTQAVEATASATISAILRSFMSFRIGRR